MKTIEKFITKTGREVEIIEPTMEWLDEILRFANTLAKEDTFLSFYPGKEIVHEDEEKWLASQIERRKAGLGFLYWAIYNGKIVGSVDVNRGSSVRNYHVGTIGIMVDKNFRGEGLGKFLLQFVVSQAKTEGMRLVRLGVFSDNEIARNLYNKMGFIEYGVLPDGLYRKGKFSDYISMYKRVN
jgi:RimJ/RimL family protein N-acetyltransferase